MKKKTAITWSIIVAVPLLFIIYKSVKFQNIYDEIYYDSAGATGEIFSRRSTLGNIKGISGTKTSSIHEGDEVIVTERYGASYLPSKINSLYVVNESNKKKLFIDITYRLDSKTVLYLSSSYNAKGKELKKDIYYVASDQDGSIKDPKKVKSLIDKYHISKEQLDYWYELGMTKTLLEDWCSVYPSRFSPEKLGHVKIETQWADYK
ncbi:TipC family immunity protein [Xylocopilactobacillus apicola]|uniref:TipC family immunity protein n=1 Tax=Xylocopilactobacillus apicola TaxID=2932184 RepID=A0AAU9DAE6_9LACO|nr:TipC family immunity protein [Xylocopilactobacillus apicola]BDR59411.1 hypothetical protein XA3_18520 [Xylocopilactobacillus apicola]